MKQKEREAGREYYEEKRRIRKRNSEREKLSENFMKTGGEGGKKEEKY